jgi:GntR family transcriptional regulator, rspAB operon transcriptional repressor
MAPTATKKTAANSNAAADALTSGGVQLASNVGGLSVFESLRERIIALELAPGAVLNRAELQVEFGLSSTPIRDALIRLAEDGLLDIIPQSVTRVSLIDVEQARQALFLRRAIEIEAVRTLAGLAERPFVAELTGLVQQQLVLADAQNVGGFYASDWQFHRRLYELAGAPDLWLLVRQRSGHIDRIRRLDLPAVGKMAKIVHDHAQIVAAIADADQAAAEAQMRDHLSRSLSLSPALRDANPAYFSPVAGG